MIPANKGKTYPAEYMPPEDVERLFAACSSAFVGKRNRALMAIMWRSGLRVSEALALREYDVDWARWTIRVRHGKGDKARTAKLISRRAQQTVEEWMEERAKLELGEDAPLLCTRDGKQLTTAYVRHMLPRLAAKAGLRRRVHAHGFRHAFAVDLHQRHVPVAYIQRLLGHSSLATTQTYLASLSPEDAFDALDLAFRGE